MIDLRHITKLTLQELEPLLLSSRAEGFRFVDRLWEEWVGGTMCFDAPEAYLLGVYEGDQLLGIGGVAADGYGNEPGVGRLRRLYVLPSHRGIGIGRGLVNALEARAREHFHALVLRTDTQAAARFYEHLGYIPLPAGGTATHRRELAARASQAKP